MDAPDDTPVLQQSKGNTLIWIPEPASLRPQPKVTIATLLDAYQFPIEESKFIGPARF